MVQLSAHVRLALNDGAVPIPYAAPERLVECRPRLAATRRRRHWHLPSPSNNGRPDEWDNTASRFPSFRFIHFRASYRHSVGRPIASVASLLLKALAYWVDIDTPELTANHSGQHFLQFRIPHWPTVRRATPAQRNPATTWHVYHPCTRRCRPPRRSGRSPYPTYSGNNSNIHAISYSSTVSCTLYLFLHSLDVNKRFFRTMALPRANLGHCPVRPHTCTPAARSPPSFRQPPRQLLQF